MKIRRKGPTSRAGRLLHVVGHSSDAADLGDLRSWFDLEYGGPLTFKAERPNAADVETNLLLMNHGPWSAWIRLSIPLLEANEWKTRLAWRHDHAGAIVGASLTPRQAIDSILHAARLARGLTLLTEGTAYDVMTQTYMNPADWKDRPLDRFHVNDHVEIFQADASDAGLEWFYTRGLTKFGLDDIETFRPKGLPTRDATEILADIADEFIALGHSPSVGLTISLSALGISVHVVRHRTAFPTECPLALREITWSPLE